MLSKTKNYGCSYVRGGLILNYSSKGEEYSNSHMYQTSFVVTFVDRPKGLLSNIFYKLYYKKLSCTSYIIQVL